jgi:hypothetical protein
MMFCKPSARIFCESPLSTAAAMCACSARRPGEMRDLPVMWISSLSLKRAAVSLTWRVYGRTWKNYWLQG